MLCGDPPREHNTWEGSPHPVHRSCCLMGERSHKSRFLLVLRPGIFPSLQRSSAHASLCLGQMIALHCIDCTDYIFEARLSCPHRGTKWCLRCSGYPSCPYRANGKSSAPLGELHPPGTTTGTGLRDVCNRISPLHLRVGVWELNLDQCPAGTPLPGTGETLIYMTAIRLEGPQRQSHSGSPRFHERCSKLLSF